MILGIRTGNLELFCIHREKSMEDEIQTTPCNLCISRHTDTLKFSKKQAETSQDAGSSVRLIFASQQLSASYRGAQRTVC